MNVPTESPPSGEPLLTADAERIAAEVLGVDVGTDPFVAAVRATRMPMVITNPRLPDNPVVFANDSFCRMCGYAREEILGRNCRFLQGPDTDPDAIARIREAVFRAEPIEIDIRNRRKDGDAFWNRLLLAPVYDTEGVLAYFFASQVDVTLERERLQGLESSNASLMAELTDRLRSQDEQKRELAFTLKAARFGTWSLDVPTRRLTASETCKELFGRPLEEPFTYDERLASIHPDDREASDAEVARCVAEGSDYDVVYRIVRPDGELRWIASRGQAFYGADGQPLRISGVSTDVTEQRRAETMRAALVELADVLRDVEEPSEISLASAGIIGRALGVDRVGYGKVDLDAETVAIANGWHAPRLDGYVGTLRFQDHGGYIADLKAGETVVVVDALSDRRTERTAERLVAVGARAFANLPVMEHGRLVALLYLTHASPRAWREDEIEFACDVAERTRIAMTRRQAERELSALAGSLEEQVVARTAELQEAQDALRQSQKMEAVGQLTGGVAHDFNNLLTVIRSATDLLRRPGLVEEKRTRYVDAIAETADRAAKLTGQLLAFARRQALRPEVIDVGANVRGLSDMLATLVGSRISVDIRVPELACHASVDPSQLDTAMVNLAANARDAMDGEGSIVIEVGSAAEIPAVRSHPAVPGRFVTIALTDAGTGIPAEQLDRIFEPFFTTKKVGLGTGLGLSQVFGFAKQSDGDVIVESVVGRGTTFTLYLHMSEEKADTPTEAAADGDASGSDGRGVRVLVVEDNRDVGAFTTQSLGDLGYVTVLASDAEQALVELERDAGRFDVVFSDVVMPGMNGIELAERIRATHPTLPVVLTSGYSDVLAESGAHGFDLLHKPYSIDQLSKALRAALS